MRAWLPVALGVLAATPLGAQTVSLSKVDETTYRHAVTEERRNIFAANLALGPAERDRFWTVYDDYVKERAPSRPSASRSSSAMPTATRT